MIYQSTIRESLVLRIVEMKGRGGLVENDPGGTTQSRNHSKNKKHLSSRRMEHEIY